MEVQPESTFLIWNSVQSESCVSGLGQIHMTLMHYYILVSRCIITFWS